MSRLLSSWLLLAEGDYWENVAQGFRGYRTDVRTGDIVLGVLIVVIAAVSLWLLARLVGADERRRRCDRPWLLFWDLCRAHGLTWSDRWLLRRVARHQRLREPARLFLEPERLEPANAGPRAGDQAERLRWLQRKLLGSGWETRGQPSRRAPGDASSPPVDRPPSHPDPQLAGPDTPGGEAKESGPVFPLSVKPGLDIPPWLLQCDAGAESPSSEVS